MPVPGLRPVSWTAWLVTSAGASEVIASPYSTWESAGSSVVQRIVADVPVIAVACTPEMTGAVVSAGTGVLVGVALPVGVAVLVGVALPVGVAVGVSAAVV